jgi:hypothetical protein
MPLRRSDIDKGKVLGVWGLKHSESGKRMYSKRAVAKLLNMSRNSVDAITRKMKRRRDMDKHRKATAAQKKKRGVHKQFVADVERLARSRRVDAPELPACCSVRQIHTALRVENNNVAPSISSIRRALHEAKLANYVRPACTLSTEAARVKRLGFCNDWLGWRIKRYGSRMVFSDEHWMSSNDFGCRTMWVEKKEDLIGRRTLARNNAQSFQIWAAIGFNWRSPIVFFDEKKVPLKKGE